MSGEGTALAKILSGEQKSLIYGPFTGSQLMPSSALHHPQLINQSRVIPFLNNVIACYGEEHFTCPAWRDADGFERWKPENTSQGMRKPHGTKSSRAAVPSNAY